MKLVNLMEIKFKNAPWQHTPNPDAHDPRSVPPL